MYLVRIIIIISSITSSLNASLATSGTCVTTSPIFEILGICSTDVGFLFLGREVVFLPASPVSSNISLDSVILNFTV